MTALTIKKDARLDLKTTQQNKELLVQAALVRGVDMTTFIIEPALKAAREVVMQSQLQAEEQKALYEALAKPSAPTKALKELMALGPIDES
ncbi:hypothetical protein A28LD_1586 [Idiomarina sp. A28L]|uniref:type II toxin-antitoxin system TacA family antitoxin n=1 Tax=Idiomarina sp. A28L TaxID=1036674 RepID=UPI0002138BBF|nr:DUF1778 domain-containing protein [Idiomarina sp. A28L]EGN74574.1 hypothetical protein A28LD_1586 [Idiomarina sp. A28L]